MGGSEGVGSLFQVSSPGGVAAWGIDVGPDHQDGAVSESLSSQVCAEAQHKASKEAHGGGSWDYPTPAAEIMEVVFKDIRTYVTRIQNTVTQHIETRPIMDLWSGLLRRQGHGCLGSGGCRTNCTWRGIRIEYQRSWTERTRKARRRD